MKKETEHRIVLVMILFAVLFILIGNQGETKRFDALTPFEQGWTMDGEALSMPFDIRKEEGGVYSVKNVLPPSFEKEMAITFKSENLYWDVLLDGESIASYQEEDLKVGLTPGDLWNVILIPEGSAGKEIEIQMYVVFEKGSNLLRTIHFAPIEIAMQATNMQGILGFVICIMIFVTSLFYIIADIFVFRKHTSGHALVSWAFFSMSMALWSLSQIPIVHLMLGNGMAIRMLSYATLPFVLAFAAVFVSRRKTRKEQAVAGIVALICMIWGVLTVVLDTFGFVSYVRTLSYTQYFILLLMLIVVVQSIINFKNYKKKTFQQKIYMYGNVGLILASGWDMYRVYNLGTADYSRNVRVALLIYSLFVGVDFFAEFIEYVKRAESVNVMEKLAHADGLTGISNRMAFDELIEEIIKTDRKEVSVVQLDVNNLKTMNDEFGHLEGDKLLKMVALTIEAAFPDGQCFRYGGDEFVVVFLHRDRDAIEIEIDKFLERQESINLKQELKIPMSVAYGYAILDDRSTIFDTIKKADDAMYNKKRQMKKK